MKLDVWDFDGTLAATPENTPENQRKYEKAFGIPWLIDKDTARQLSKKLKKEVPLRRGWWGRPETLQPPLVPDPAPKSLFNAPMVERFLASKRDEDAVTVILTGRHMKMKNDVLRILDDGGLVKIHRKHDVAPRYSVVDHLCQVYCLGEKGPAPNLVPEIPGDTFPWKVWMINQFLHVHPDIEEIEIWEDRDEHVENFRQFGESLAHKLVVNHVKI